MDMYFFPKISTQVISLQRQGGEMLATSEEDEELSLWSACQNRFLPSVVEFSCNSEPIPFRDQSKCVISCPCFHQKVGPRQLRCIGGTISNNLRKGHPETVHLWFSTSCQVSMERRCPQCYSSEWATVSLKTLRHFHLHQSKPDPLVLTQCPPLAQEHRRSHCQHQWVETWEPRGP